MVEYKIVKHCLSCKARFVVDRTESKRMFCDKCQARQEPKKD